MANTSFYGLTGTTAEVQNTIQASVDAAATSATNSATSETNSAASEAAALASENAAAASADAAASSAAAVTGATASVLQKTGGAMTGAITTNSTFDGRDVAADGAKLDLIDDSADVTDAGNVNPLVDARLNQSTAASGEVLSWNGSDYDWIVAGGGGDLLAANNLSDLDNAATARTNLGLGTAATTASTDYATAAQGTLASSALQSGDNVSLLTNNAGYLTSVPAQSFSSLTGKPTTISGYGITDAFNGAYASLTGKPTIPTNNNQLTNGAGYITSVPAQSFSSLTGKPTTISGYGITDVNSNIDTHLNQSTAASGELLSWNGSNYDWIAAGGGGDLLAGNNLSDLANAATARTNLGLGTAATTASTDYATAAQGATADAALANVVEDTSPQLGGDLSVNGYSISSTTNSPINLDAAGTGKVVFKGNATKGSGQFVLNCEQNSHGITIKGPPHSAAATYTLTLPDTDGSASEFLQTDGSGNLSWSAGATSYSDTNVDAHLNTSTAGTNEVLSWTGSDYDWVAQSGGGGGISNVVEDTTPQLGGDLDVNSKAINFGDSDGTTTNMLTFGAGDDLKIYHHATAGTYITESGTGNLNLRAGDLRLMNGAGFTTLQSQSSGIRISNSYTLPTSDGTSGQVMTTDGAGAVSFTTVSGGGISNVVEDTTPQLGGNLQTNSNDIVFADNDKAIFGANTDLEIYSDATSSYVHSKKAGGYLRLKSEGGIVLQAGNSENVLFAAQNGKTALYFDAAEKLETTSTGVAITGTLAATAVKGGEVVGTISSGTLDLSTGNVFSDAPAANVTYVFNNPPASGTAFGFTLKVTPSGTYTVTWPASVDWAGGTAPTAPASGETDVFTFYTQDGGTTYYGFQAGDAMG